MDTSQPITETALVPLTGLTREQLTGLRIRFMSETANHWHADPTSREIIINPSGLEILLGKLTEPENEKKGPPAAEPPPSAEKKDGPVELTVTRRLANQRFVQASDGTRTGLVVRVINHLDWRIGDTLTALPVPGQPHAFTHTGPRPKGRQRSVWAAAKKEGGAS